MALPYGANINGKIKLRPKVPIFGQFKLDDTLYYYDKLSLSVIHNVSLNKSIKKTEKTGELYYYSKDETDKVEDKDLIVKLDKEYKILLKIKEVHYLIRKKIKDRKFKQAEKEFIIGTRFIVNTKYGGVLKLKVHAISMNGDTIHIISSTHHHSYDIKYCTSNKELRLKKFKNIL